MIIAGKPILKEEEGQTMKIAFRAKQAQLHRRHILQILKECDFVSQFLGHRCTHNIR